MNSKFSMIDSGEGHFIRVSSVSSSILCFLQCLLVFPATVSW